MERESNLHAITSNLHARIKRPIEVYQNIISNFR